MGAFLYQIESYQQSFKYTSLFLTFLALSHPESLFIPIMISTVELVLFDVIEITTWLTLTTDKLFSPQRLDRVHLRGMTRRNNPCGQPYHDCNGLRKEYINHRRVYR